MKRLRSVAVVLSLLASVPAAVHASDPACPVHTAKSRWGYITPSGSVLIAPTPDVGSCHPLADGRRGQRERGPALGDASIRQVAGVATWLPL